MTAPDLNSLLENLSDEDISSLGDMAQQLFGNMRSEQPEATTSPFGGIDPGMLSSIMQVLPLLQGSEDNDRTRLINALKPMLSHHRRKKADEAIQLMKLFEILPLVMGR